MRKRRASFFIAAAIGLFALAGQNALAGGHTWRINEIFSNTDGTIQFIEMKEIGGGAFETATNGNRITSNTKSFTLTSNVVSPTSFKHILFGTAAFAALSGAPTPNYIIPANFFSVSGDTVSYIPYDNPGFLSFVAGELPTDGIQSLNRGDGTEIVTDINSPTNYAGVTGSVDLSPSPPGVPDGAGGGTPMTVQALDLAGTQLSVDWDAATCSGATDHRIIYGEGSDLPIAPGGVFGVTGSVCGIGAPPYIWDPAPSAADGSGLIWWIVVVGDGTKEGPWGDDSSGAERIGPGPAGSSGQCGVTTKSLSNACGH